MSGGGLFTGRPVEVLSWIAHAWCVACGWSIYDDTEDVVRAAARAHRANPSAR